MTDAAPARPLVERTENPCVECSIHSPPTCDQKLRTRRKVWSFQIGRRCIAGMLKFERSVISVVTRRVRSQAFVEGIGQSATPRCSPGREGPSPFRPGPLPTS
jgi:hypothetical protein